jgi:hypothetical protein
VSSLSVCDLVVIPEPETPNLTIVLCVARNRIRADNEARTDLTRKAGLIINDGGKLTKEQKLALQEESKSKYGLTQEQMDTVDAALEEIYGSRMKDDEEVKRHRGLVEELVKEVVGERPERAVVEGWSREEKMAKLRELHEKLEQAQHVYRYHVSRQCQQTFQRKHKADGGENNPAKANKAPAVGGKKTGSKPSAKRGKRFNTNGNKPKRGKKCDVVEILSEEDADAMDMGDDDVAKECRDAGHEANISALIAMGFGRRQAMDALEETNGSVEGAVEWLMVHCVG